MNKLVVLLCSYQGEQFIAAQLESLICQTYQPTEIHVFDDCSYDNTQMIVQDYVAKYDHIFLHINDNNIGFVNNFEQALSSVGLRSRYIALCDQDDIWHPDKLELSMKAMKSLEADHALGMAALVHADLSFIDESGRAFGSSFFKKKLINLRDNRSLSRILGHCGVMGNTLLINRFLLDKALPFPNGLKYHDYWLAVVNELFGVRKTIPETLVKYRLHSDNNSNNARMIEKKVLSFKWIHRNFRLPFMEDNREVVMRNLLGNAYLRLEDRRLIKGFYQYLLFKGVRWQLLSFLLKYDFLRSSVKYRTSVFFRMMLTKRYMSEK